ncbi:1-deoxy-D-xylulose-5-phosphate reductoisomerase [Candidatus Omnitrophota bacterium]
MKNVLILGSTGSIGKSALKVIESMPERFRVVGLSTFSNIKLLEEQIRKFKPSMVGVVDRGKAKDLKKRITTKGLRVYPSSEGLNVLAQSPKVDIVIMAISGAGAIDSLFASIKKRKHICLANKESIVMAGDIIMKKAKAYGAKIIPVDSEHSAIFQCIDSARGSDISRILLTGSGGPLLNIPKSKFKSLTVKKVLNHPKWKMGRKITVDSATLMNKGLEIIEAKHLFDIDIEKIELLIHPEAIVHSMVEFIDGTIMAQLGVTDMMLPIQAALTYPERVRGVGAMLDFSKISKMNFVKPDLSKFPCLSLALAAIKLGGTYPTVLNAADEIAVKAFLDRKIQFVMIPKVVEKILTKHRAIAKPSIDDILDADTWARKEAHNLC